MLFAFAPLFADETSTILVTAKFWDSVISSFIFGILGIGLIVLAVKIFDWISPKIDVQIELAEKKNTAVAIVVAAIVIGMSYLMATAIH
jgi:putative membrane protein